MHSAAPAVSGEKHSARAPLGRDTKDTDTDSTFLIPGLVWSFLCVCVFLLLMFLVFLSPPLAPSSSFLIGDEITTPELGVPPHREDPCSDAA